MSEVLKAEGFNVISTTLDDQGYGEAGVDVLTSERRARVVVTNPPFSIAAEIIEHLWFNLEVDTLALLLKSQYWHSKRRMNLFQRSNPEWVLPLLWRPNFDPELAAQGKAPTMDFQWTVWRRGYIGHTKYAPLRKP